MAWLEEAAPRAVAGNQVPLVDGSSADLDVFESIFAEVPTLIDGGMSAYDALVQVDGGTRGWKATFDSWKSLGII